MASGSIIGSDGARIERVYVDNLDIDNSLMTGTSRLRTVPAVEQWSAPGFRYSNGDELWLNPVNNGGTITSDLDQKCKVITLDTTANGNVIRQTRQRYTYFSGNAHMLTLACRSEIAVGRATRVGYYDDFNGAFFEWYRQDENTYISSVVRRSSASGSTVDEVVTQNSWNSDHLDGLNGTLNTSNFQLDPTKIQMVYIDFTWYGGGEIQMGYKIKRKHIPVHTFYAGNYTEEPIMGDPNQPVRTEIIDKSGTVGSGNTTLRIWGIHLGIDGSDPALRDGFPRSVYTEQSVSTGVTTNVLAIRPKLIYNGVANHSLIRLKDFQIATAVNGYYQIIYNPVLTTPSWVDVNTNNSLVEYDVSSSGYTNGEVLYTGVISSSKGGDKISIPNFKAPLAVASDDSVSYPLLVTFTGDANGDVKIAINWEEIY